MKKILAVMVLLVVLFVSGCSSSAPCFDFTASEFEDAFIDCGIYLDEFSTTEGKDNSMITSYTFSTDNDAPGKYMHYMAVYDAETEKVSHISFFFDKDFMGDIESALARYYVHIGILAELINPGADRDAIYNEIANVNGTNEGIDGSAIYQCEEFTLHASCDSERFRAVFLPPDFTK